MSDTTLGIKSILDYLPHRYPFLLVDRVVEVKRGESIRAYKNLTFNEPFFQGHFPGVPVMPGVLIIEAMAQAGVAGHLRIGNGVTIGPQSGIAKDIPDGQTVGGTPAVDYTTFMRTLALMPRFPELFKRLSKLEKELEALRADDIQRPAAE